MAETLEHSEIYGGSEDTNSVCEEERVRKLFQACDGDGDGYIDSHVLRSVCRELRLEQSLEEALRAAGADERGRVSYEDFLRCRLALRPPAATGPAHSHSHAAGASAATQTPQHGAAAHAHAQQQQQLSLRHRATPEYLPTGSDHSLGAASAGKHESWEFDSGARDLSPEPHALQKIVEAAGSSLGAGSSSGMFELANKLHLAALTSLKGEILELSNRLHSVTQERDLLEERLTKAQVEKLRMTTAAEEQAEVQAQRYEERITELNLVISELRRTLDHERSVPVQEEDPMSENEEGLLHDAGGSTANLADVSEQQEGCSSSEEGHRQNEEVDAAAAESSVKCRDVDRTFGEEAEVAAGQEAGTLTPTGSCCDEGVLVEEGGKENDFERRKLRGHLSPDAPYSRHHHHHHHHHLHDKQLSAIVACSLAEELAVACGSTASGCQTEHLRSPRKMNIGSRVESPECCEGPRCASTGSLAVVPRDDMPVCKVAERVTLRRMDPQITGSQLASLGVSHTPVAESLVSELRAADAAELARGGESCAHHEVEREQLSARLEHARAQKRVLALALEESRAQAERLILLVGKYESNATALRLALGYSDRAIEAYDVLVALLESELGLLLASCRSLGLASFGLHAAEEVSLDGVDKASLLKKARDNRYAAETVAKHVLARLEIVAVGIPVAPWEDYSHAASEADWGEAEERRLRDHIVRLKTERATVRGTILELESCHVEPPGACVTLTDACKLDLETAVLMQELMAVREERAELRARLYLLEKDKTSQELRLGAQELQLQQLQVQIQDLQPAAGQSRNVGVEGDGSAQCEEASRREARLRERMHGLVATLEKVSRNSELRHQQSADLINDLKHANSTLLQTLDRSKKKYQSRIKKLEQRMLEMAERHAHEVRTLKQRVADLESEVAVVSRTANVFGIASVGVTTHSSTASETSL